MATRRSNSLSLYLLLGVLALASVLFHFRSLEQIFPRWFGIVRAEWPFLLEAEDKPQFLLQYLQANAQEAGLQDRDELMAINGVPMRSRAAFADLLARSAPGSAWDVRYRRPSQLRDRHARFALQRSVRRSDPLVVLLFLAMPVFCLALGFWVVFVRLHDIRAWLLLMFLLSVATAFDSFSYLWEPGWRLFGSLYRRFFDSGGIACLFLLGLYFPEPFARVRRWPWWKWLTAIVMPLWALFFLADLISFITELYSVSAAIPFNIFLVRTRLSSRLIYVVLALSFLACIGVKYRIASSQDVRRRVRVLFAGTALGLLPLTVFFTIQQWGGGTESSFAEWFRIMVYLSFLLLPITFAYVIVVQRALDVRVVLRQGLQYTLASRGTVILQLLLSMALFFLAWGLVASRSVSAPVTVATIGVGVAGLVLLQNGRKRLALWIDRRFFRDAYYLPPQCE